MQESGRRLSEEQRTKQAMAFLKSCNATLNRIESGAKPVVAAVNGVAFGGGLELAMACAARVGVPKSVYGLPELRLGIIPGFGGTQRLARLIGVGAAVQATLKSSTLSASKAAKAGLVDRVVDDPSQLLSVAIDLARKIADGQAPRSRALLDESRIGDKQRALQTIAGIRAAVSKNRKLRGLPHPTALLDAVEAGVQLGGERGLAREMEIMARLIHSPTAKSFVHVFLSTKAAAHIPGIRITPDMVKRVQRVGVLGGGTMGSGIVALYLLRGYDVVLKEINQKFLDAGVGRVRAIVTRAVGKKVQRQMGGKKQVASDKAAYKAAVETATRKVLERLTPQLDYAAFDRLDLVIEAVIEVVPLKQRIFGELEAVCSSRCILATNTSTIDIDLIAQGCKKQSSRQRVVGLHFFSPAHVMPLLEIIKTSTTLPDVLAVSVAMCKRIAKTGVLVNNCVGFTANRMFFPYGQAASLLVDHGVDPYAIDSALRQFGMPMGVFEMADLSGIDVFAHVSRMIDEAYGDRCYHSTFGKRLGEAKRLGQKTGAGYYKYVNRRRTNDPAEIEPFLRAARADAGNPSLGFEPSPVDLVEMVLFPVINESYRIVDEGHVFRESDVDIVSVTGYGFPAARGGACFYGREVGLDYVVRRLREFAARIGGGKNAKVQAFFQPCDRLVRESLK
eukprot:TRINITY_DN65959_c3_g1_i1.p1 TRINITY_DN65959_c3_g1~~TRINITY_DN65959_c3_g1_i1.p1  ORF type:complete len:794 (-),score=473.12 TRINITY_DN65959_c3_g1_i1:82-2106(-)